MEMDHEVIVAALTGKATEAERAALREWRDARPENDALYGRYERLWSRLGRLGPVGVEPQEAAPLRARRRRRAAPLAGVVAAGLALGIALGLRDSRDPSPASFGARDVVTGEADLLTLTLHDGTVVRLGPDSRFGVRRSAGPRDVYLEGRAYFAVPGGLDEPFRVHTAGGAIEVLGTRFDLEARDSAVRVVVVQGTVEIDADGRRVRVAENGSGGVTAAGEPTVSRVDDVYRSTSWLGDFIVFQATPLPEVAVEFERRFGVRLEIENRALADHTVTGWFGDQPPLAMLENVCLAVASRCTVGDGVVRME